MYPISKLSKPSIEFVNKVAAMGGSRSGLFTIAVAYTVSRQFNLPAGEVSDCTAYFRLQCESEVREMLNTLNEVMPFNTREALELTLAFYKFRYRSAVPIAIPLAFSADSALEDFFGLSQVFSQEILGRIKVAPSILTGFVNGLSIMMDELKVARLAQVAAQSAKMTGVDDRHVAA